MSRPVAELRPIAKDVMRFLEQHPAKLTPQDALEVCMFVVVMAMQPVPDAGQMGEK